MDTKYFPISVHFVKPATGLTGVPLCESSAALTALSHMICRSHLIDEHKKKTLANLPEDDRLRFSLYLASIDRQRQTFNLDWFADGVLPQFSPPKADKLLLLLHKSLSLYVNSCVPQKPTNKAEKLALSIFGDFWDLTGRIGKVGKIQQIEIRILDLDSITIDESVKGYAESLKGITLEGRARNLKGVVEAPKTLKRDLLMLRTNNQLVKVYTDNLRESRKMLNLVLNVLAKYPNPMNQPDFIFHGKPRFKINDEPDHFPEFILNSKKLGQTKYVLPSGETYLLEKDSNFVTPIP